MSELLTSSGVFISVTFSQPHFRRPVYVRQTYKWDVELHTIGEHFHIFVFVMTKDRTLSESDKKLEEDHRNKCDRLRNLVHSEPVQTFDDTVTENDFIESFMTYFDD